MLLNAYIKVGIIVNKYESCFFCYGAISKDGNDVYVKIIVTIH